MSVFICVALGVGFFTLMERKILSYLQVRKGPNKPGMVGLPLPLSDAGKLFSKENIKIRTSNKPIFVIGPVFAVGIMIILWILYIRFFGFRVKFGILLFFAISSLNVYRVFISGWASNSKYALLGSIRAVAQTISYEVRLALTIIVIMFLCLRFNVKDVYEAQQHIYFMFVVPLTFIIWIVRCLAETNRAPFDLAEGESELVSGFNIEYGGGEFAFLFIAEYGRILLIRMLTMVLFIGGSISFSFVNVIKVGGLAFFFLWVRGSYPRVRYDFLISLTWKTFLTVVIGYGVIVLRF